MNPYKIKVALLKESKAITDEKELIKLHLVSNFLKCTAKMDSKEISTITGLNKADLSRLRSLNIERFSIDRMIGILTLLGFSTKIVVKPNRKAS